MSSPISAAAAAASSGIPPQFYRLEGEDESLQFKPVEKKEIKRIQYSALEALKSIEANIDELRTRANTLEYVDSILGAYRKRVDSTVQKYYKSWACIKDKIGLSATGTQLSEDLRQEANEVETVYHRIVSKLHEPEARSGESIVLEIIGNTPENAVFVSDLFRDLKRKDRAALGQLIQSYRNQMVVEWGVPLKKFVASTADALARNPSQTPLKYLAVQWLSRPYNLDLKNKTVQCFAVLWVGNDPSKQVAAKNLFASLDIANAFSWMGWLLSSTEETKEQLLQQVNPHISLQDIDGVLDKFPEQERGRLFPLVMSLLSKRFMTGFLLGMLLSGFNHLDREIVLRTLLAGDYRIAGDYRNEFAENYLYPKSIAKLFMADERLIDSFYQCQVDVLHSRPNDKRMQTETLHRISKQVSFDQKYRLMLMSALKLVPEHQRAELVQGLSPYFWHESAPIPWKQKQESLRQALGKIDRSQYDDQGQHPFQQLLDLLDNKNKSVLSKADKVVDYLRAIPVDQRAELLKLINKGRNDSLSDERLTYLLLYPKAERMAHIRENKDYAFISLDIREISYLFPEEQRMKQTQRIKNALNQMTEARGREIVSLLKRVLKLVPEAQRADRFQEVMELIKSLKGDLKSWGCVLSDLRDLPLDLRMPYLRKIQQETNNHLGAGIAFSNTSHRLFKEDPNLKIKALEYLTQGLNQLLSAYQSGEEIPAAECMKVHSLRCDAVHHFDDFIDAETLDERALQARSYPYGQLFELNYLAHHSQDATEYKQVFYRKVAPAFKKVGAEELNEFFFRDGSYSVPLLKVLETYSPQEIVEFVTQANKHPEVMKYVISFLEKYPNRENINLTLFFHLHLENLIAISPDDETTLDGLKTVYCVLGWAPPEKRQQMVAQIREIPLPILKTHLVTLLSFIFMRNEELMQSCYAYRFNKLVACPLGAPEVQVIGKELLYQAMHDQMMSLSLTALSNDIKSRFLRDFAPSYYEGGQNNVLPWNDERLKPFKPLLVADLQKILENEYRYIKEEAKSFARAIELVPDQMKADVMIEWLMSDDAPKSREDLLTLFSEEDREEHFETLKDLFLWLKENSGSDGFIERTLSHLASIPEEERLTTAKAMMAPVEAQAVVEVESPKVSLEDSVMSLVKLLFSDLTTANRLHRWVIENKNSSLLFPYKVYLLLRVFSEEKRMAAAEKLMEIAINYPEGDLPSVSDIEANLL